ncbi:killer suppression protein [Candidatus Sulfurimonas marisnigri]|uniref:Killer suppression protein n=1 Tax=Candidatus Sulfurimonas marisnigri TaxID=2740405 RepID=A0A7S7M2G4_9BACT|nr:killer suppression protein [Candidatus Sulfurimonas marisnigri]QOY55323.1 killer suppression protein [Candidatus Sulfurimonas marisnigri]
MVIEFSSTKLQKIFEDERKLLKEMGKKRAKKIKIRMTEFRAADSLHDFWPPKSGPSRCHELTEGEETGKKLSVDLDHPYRLIFEVDQEPIPIREEGGLDWKVVKQIKIIGIEDTHE